MLHRLQRGGDLRPEPRPCMRRARVLSQQSLSRRNPRTADIVGRGPDGVQQPIEELGDAGGGDI